MTESGFEARLARGLREMADDGTRPFDARAVAEAVAATRRGPFDLGPWLATRGGRRWFAFAAAALLLAGLLGLALALAGSRSPRPADTGRLAFVRNGDIWIANLDGTGARILVARDPKEAESLGYMGVQWSPDGSRLAAAIGPNGSGQAGEPRRIAILTVAGTPIGTFNVEAAGDVGPEFAWSADGNHLAVLAPEATGGPLWLLDREGRLERTLEIPRSYRADMPMTDFWFSWSPDSRSIAVGGCPCSSEDNRAWIIAVDGSGAREIRTPGKGNALFVAWSPDGTRLAIGSGKWLGPVAPDAGPGELWVMNVDGGSARRLATSVGPLFVSGWSPDGTWIAYGGPAEGSDGMLGLVLVRADGSREPVLVGAVGQGTVRWTEHERLVYLVEPNRPCCAGSENPGSAYAALKDLQALGSVMVLDPAGGPPTLVADRVDPYAVFDLSKPPTKAYQLTPDACASAAVVYSGRVAGSFLTTIGAIRAMALFAQGDPWPGDPADRAAALCYIDVQVATVSAPPGSGTSPPILARDILVVIDGQPGINLMKAGPRDNVPVVAP